MKGRPIERKKEITSKSVKERDEKRVIAREKAKERQRELEFFLRKSVKERWQESDRQRKRS